MALFNYASKEITLKVVYYGPGLCGKTTNLQKLHETMASDKKGKLLSLSTDADRTLFFDFMPIQLGKIKDFNIRFQLYTVPGQVRYNATRKLVLKGADAVVFVADSQKAMKDQNIESIQNMRENLIANNINPDEIPVILQYNKRDLKNISSVAEMNADLNPRSDEVVEASAYEGWGVDETFKLVTKRLLKFISKKHNVQIAAPEEEAPAQAPARPLAAAAAATPAPAQKKPEKSDKIHISVKDKAEQLLNEEPVAASAAMKDAMDWSDLMPGGSAASKAQAEEEVSSWQGTPVEIEPAGQPAHEMSITDDEIFTSPSIGGTGEPSLLEKMLEEEQKDMEMGSLDLETPSAPPREAEHYAAAPDSSNTALVLERLLEAMEESNRLQKEMLTSLKSIDASLKAATQRPAAPKPTR